MRTTRPFCLDVTYVKVRTGGRVLSITVIVTVAAATGREAARRWPSELESLGPDEVLLPRQSVGLESIGAGTVDVGPDGLPPPTLKVRCQPHGHDLVP
jgi:hypothetical protein